MTLLSQITSIDASFPPSSTHTLTLTLYGQCLAFINLISFLSYLRQYRGLSGDQGILPSRSLTLQAQQHHARARTFPSLLLLVPASLHSSAVLVFCLLGIASSLASMFLLVPPSPSLLLSAVLYLSITTVARPFYATQCDAAIIESSFLYAIVAPFHPSLQLFTARFLVFRIMLACGVVKLASGHRSWKQLRALDSYYETQTLPSPLAYAAHMLLPTWVQRLSTLATLIIEGPLALFLAPFCFDLVSAELHFAAVAGVFLLSVLISLTGSYGVLNLLTFIQCLPVLSDAQLLSLFPPLAQLPTTAAASLPTSWNVACLVVFVIPHTVLALAPLRLACDDFVPTWLDLPQWVKDAQSVASSFRVCNLYGKFAVVSERRLVIVLSGSDDGVAFSEYHFKYAPGPLDRAPPAVGLYSPRLDLAVWSLPLVPHGHTAPWFTSLITALLQGREDVLSLMSYNPFPGTPPRIIRADVFEYSFARGDERTREQRPQRTGPGRRNPRERVEYGAWWKRRFVCPFGDHIFQINP